MGGCSGGPWVVARSNGGIDTSTIEQRAAGSTSSTLLGSDKASITISRRASQDELSEVRSQTQPPDTMPSSLTRRQDPAQCFPPCPNRCLGLGKCAAGDSAASQSSLHERARQDEPLELRRLQLPTANGPFDLMPRDSGAPTCLMPNCPKTGPPSNYEATLTRRTTLGVTSSPVQIEVLSRNIDTDPSSNKLDYILNCPPECPNFCESPTVCLAKGEIVQGRSVHDGAASLELASGIKPSGDSHDVAKGGVLSENIHTSASSAQPDYILNCPPECPNFCESPTVCLAKAETVQGRSVKDGASSEELANIKRQHVFVCPAECFYTCDKNTGKCPDPPPGTLGVPASIAKRPNQDFLDCPPEASENCISPSKCHSTNTIVIRRSEDKDTTAATIGYLGKRVHTYVCPPDCLHDCDRYGNCPPPPAYAINHSIDETPAGEPTAFVKRKGVPTCPEECPNNCLRDGECPTVQLRVAPATSDAAGLAPDFVKRQGVISECPEECPDSCNSAGECPPTASLTKRAQAAKCPPDCPKDCDQKGICIIYSCPRRCPNNCDETGECIKPPLGEQTHDLQTRQTSDAAEIPGSAGLEKRRQCPDLCPTTCDVSGNCRPHASAALRRSRETNPAAPTDALSLLQPRSEPAGRANKRLIECPIGCPDCDDQGNCIPATQASAQPLASVPIITSLTNRSPTDASASSSKPMHLVEREDATAYIPKSCGPGCVIPCHPSAGVTICVPPTHCGPSCAGVNGCPKVALRDLAKSSASPALSRLAERQPLGPMYCAAPDCGPGCEGLGGCPESMLRPRNLEIAASTALSRLAKRQPLSPTYCFPPNCGPACEGVGGCAAEAIQARQKPSGTLGCHGPDNCASGCAGIAGCPKSASGRRRDTTETSLQRRTADTQRYPAASAAFIPLNRRGECAYPSCPAGCAGFGKCPESHELRTRETPLETSRSGTKVELNERERCPPLARRSDLLPPSHRDGVGEKALVKRSSGFDDPNATKSPEEARGKRDASVPLSLVETLKGREPAGSPCQHPALLGRGCLEVIRRAGGDFAIRDGQLPAIGVPVTGKDEISMRKRGPA
ncbi:hypothetical protein CBOM_00278 [Ceraceosorus bombacis]|uniref:Uncharacterized protein n=1 Tax=Ceraceosorus bombacis TaxID=401625 RepID=A0A0P1B9C2_9BASI|nr:hypothetical protein CBOM_00278 [Ceraceosorus bombacis]